MAPSLNSASFKIRRSHSVCGPRSDILTQGPVFADDRRLTPPMRGRFHKPGTPIQLSANASRKNASADAERTSSEEESLILGVPDLS